MEEGKNHTDHETRYTKQPGRYQIPPDKPSQHWWKDIRYINNKPIPQVQKLKYLGIILDNKLLFREHIDYVADKCKKLIFHLPKAAKLNWGLNHKALQTIYSGGIQPLLVYGAPLWIKTIRKEKYKAKLLRVQRLINIKMAKAYRAVSHEALCVLTGTMHIDLQIEQTARIYQITKGNDTGKTQYGGQILATPCGSEHK
jgi:hypothetical protein